MPVNIYNMLNQDFFKISVKNQASEEGIYYIVGRICGSAVDTAGLLAHLVDLFACLALWTWCSYHRDVPHTFSGIDRAFIDL